MKTRTTTAALLAAAALGIGACGDEEATFDQAVTIPPATTAPAETSTTASDDGPTIQKLKISTDLKKKPAIAKPSGDPPTELYSRDIVKGKGEPVRLDDKVTVNYVGVSYSNGEQFDASWDRDEPTEFTLSQGQLIDGWLQGIPGMRPGGRRMLVIPPDLAYGEGGQGSIGPNETLIFVIDLKKTG